MNKPVPYKGNEPYIFVSYSHRDSTQVLPIIGQMQQDGCRVWYDEAISPSSPWDNTIADRIGDCTLFIAFLSKAYVLSDNCIDELWRARDKNRDRLLVYLDEAKLPSGLVMRLRNQQALLWYNYPEKENAYAKFFEVAGFARARFSPTAHMTSNELFEKATQLRMLATPASVLESFQYIRRAAELGHPEAMTDMGINCQYGNYTEQDIKQAIQWYRAAAQEGEANAAFYLAQIYMEGSDVPRDPEEALLWYHAAASRGYAEAQIKLGDIYFFGEDAEQDIPDALEWYRKAAISGGGWAPDAQHLLGQRYEALGDTEQARRWYTLALQNGYLYAYRSLQHLDKQ